MLKKFIRIILPTNVYSWFRDVKSLGYIPNINRPQSFNEKIKNRIKLNTNPIFSICSDKISVRDYVSDKGLGDILIPLNEIWMDFDPKKVNISVPCVLKANHNSGPVYVIKKSEDLNDGILNSLANQLNINYGCVNGESWYSSITPRIFSEKLLLTDKGDIPEDYKFHVFNRGSKSKVYVQVDFDRFGRHERCFYNEELELLDFGVLFKSAKRTISKPLNYCEMIRVAKKLSEDFNYVRVDLYNVNGKVYFGELTFAHGAGRERFYPQKYDRILGDEWVVDVNGNY